jgi:hypothetical protein
MSILPPAEVFAGLKGKDEKGQSAGYKLAGCRPLKAEEPLPCAEGII